MFIVFEGIDGSGKSTASKKLKDYYGDDAILIAMPSGLPTGIKVREEINRNNSDDSKIKDLLIDDFNVAIREVIRPALELGKIVICDRYIQSFIAYQSVMLSEEIVQESLKKIDLIEPDLVFFLDVEPEIALSRINREKDSIEKKGIDFFHKVRSKFIELNK